MPEKRKCKFCKTDGTTCKALALSSSDYCFFHDPDKEKARAEARRKGGISRSKPIVSLLPVDKEPNPLQTMADLKRALAEVFHAVAIGKIAVNVGNCLGFLGGQLSKIILGCELERELLLLKEKIAEESKNRDQYQYGYPEHFSSVPAAATHEQTLPAGPPADPPNGDPPGKPDVRPAASEPTGDGDIPPLFG